VKTTPPGVPTGNKKFESVDSKAKDEKGDMKKDHRKVPCNRPFCPEVEEGVHPSVFV